MTPLRTISRAGLVAALGAVALAPSAAVAKPPTIVPRGAHVAVQAGASDQATARVLGNGHIDDDGGPTGRT